MPYGRDASSLDPNYCCRIRELNCDTRHINSVRISVNFKLKLLLHCREEALVPEEHGLVQGVGGNYVVLRAV